MKPSEIAASYDRIVGRWTSPDFNRENGMAQHRRALAFADKKGRALDAGCGATGRFIGLLTESGFEPEGADLSEGMLREARSWHPQATFHATDLATWTPPGRYALITAWDSIWHLAPGPQRALLLRLCAALSPGGVLIFSAGGLEACGEKTDEAMGVPMYYSTLGIPGYFALFAEAGVICRHFEYDQYPEAHVYFIVSKP